MSNSAFVAALLIFSGLVDRSTAQWTFNEWTKPASGNWEEPFWSLGKLPGAGQSVAITNQGWKAVAIRSATVSSYPASLQMNDLTIEAPSDAFNQLLLNYPGLTVPLAVSTDLVLGERASVVGYYCVLRSGRFSVRSSAAFSEGSIAEFGNLEIAGSGPAEFHLTNSFLSTGDLTLGPDGRFDQSGGSATATNLQMFGGSAFLLHGGQFTSGAISLLRGGPTNYAQLVIQGGILHAIGQIRLDRGEIWLESGRLESAGLELVEANITQSGGLHVVPVLRAAPPHSWYSSPWSVYTLSEGTLISGELDLGALFDASWGVHMDIHQTGGVHTNTVIRLNGELRTQTAHPYGRYILDGGLFVSDLITFNAGTFTQTGGTNYTRELLLDWGSTFLLDGGELVTSNSTLTSSGAVTASFIQNGGTHTVGHLLAMEDYVAYRLVGGSLVAPEINVGPLAVLRLDGGALSNTGAITLSGGTVSVAGQIQRFGKLAVIPGKLFNSTFTNSTLNVGNAPGATNILRFADSHDIPWTGTLTVSGWRDTTNSVSGVSHIYVGASPGSLTRAQLDRIIFALWPGYNAPATILDTGEIVPVLPPVSVQRVTDGMILTWPNGLFDLTTSTNVAGPYAPVPSAWSPWKVFFIGPESYYKLTLR